MNLVTLQDGIPFASHREIANFINAKETAVRDLVTRNKPDFEEFGHLRFKNGTVKNSAGAINQTKTYFLNEQQTSLLLTYLRNSPIVKELKKELIREFWRLKEQERYPQGLEHIILKQNEILATLSEKIGTLQEDLLFAYKQTITAQKQTIEAKPPHYNTWLTPHEADEIVRLKRNGHSLAHIQRTLQRSDFVVRRVLKEAGMYTPPYRVVHVIEEV